MAKKGRRAWAQHAASRIGPGLRSGTDAASAPTFENVARFVAGPDAPAWLVAHFKRWVKSLEIDRFVEDKQPTKVAMKRQLAEVKAAALLLRRALSDTPTRKFLEIAPQGPIDHDGVLDHLLADLAERAERAMASRLLSTETGKTKAGLACVRRRNK
jgi:hypothetical protein